MASKSELTSQLEHYVGTKDWEGMYDIVATAIELVKGYLAGYGVRLDTNGLPWEEDAVPLIPVEVYDRAVLEVGAELFHRKASRNGVAQFATGDSVSPMRISRDPLVAARGLLAPFLPTPVGLA